MTVATWLALALAAAALGLALVRAVMRRQLARRPGLVVGVFHPYCNAGGGGERVLWCAVEALQAMDAKIEVVVYAGASAGAREAILRRAKERFGVQGIDHDRVRFVFLLKERLLEASTFPRLTLLGQSLGSMVVGMEALQRERPHVFLDTMGYAFTYPLASLAGCRVACYTHYPTISTDMLARVYERRPAYNNDELVSGSAFNSKAKYVYYLGFCALYWAAGQFASVVMVNSNWTRGHIDQLWRTRASVVFPPCDTAQLVRESAKHKEEGRQRVIISLGQFRPEKDHRLQIQALARLQQLCHGEGREVPPLLLCGSCRDVEDEARVEQLRQLSARLGLGDLVRFHINEPFKELKRRLATALLGVHTMWNEHFGIAPVEMMASGVILVAHDSGGPKTDIIQHGATGFLATSADEYANRLLEVLRLHDAGGAQAAELDAIRARAVASMDRFSEERFAKGFTASMAAVVRYIS